MAHILSRLVEVFWSLFPNNFYILCLLSALSEAASTYLFKISHSRGWGSLWGYVLGFFVIAFYAEALRHSKLGQSYPIWLAMTAVLITISSFLILKEDIKFGLWIPGFVLIILGLAIIQFSLPPTK